MGYLSHVEAYSQYQPYSFFYSPPTTNALLFFVPIPFAVVVTDRNNWHHVNLVAAIIVPATEKAAKTPPVLL